MYGGDAPTVVKGGQFLAGLVDGVVNGQVTTGSTDRAGPFAFDADEPDAVDLEPVQQLLALLCRCGWGGSRPGGAGLRGQTQSTAARLGVHAGSDHAGACKTPLPGHWARHSTAVPAPA